MCATHAYEKQMFRVRMCFEKPLNIVVEQNFHTIIHFCFHIYNICWLCVFLYYIHYYIVWHIRPILTLHWFIYAFQTHFIRFWGTPLGNFNIFHSNELIFLSKEKFPIGQCSIKYFYRVSTEYSTLKVWLHKFYYTKIWN